MELNGALSNPLATRKDLQLRRLAILKRELVSREQGFPGTSLPGLGRRQGTVLATVTSVLERADGPMQMREIYAAVERVLGQAVARASVREALSAHIRTLLIAGSVASIEGGTRSRRDFNQQEDDGSLRSFQGSERTESQGSLCSANQPLGPGGCPAPSSRSAVQMSGMYPVTYLVVRPRGLALALRRVWG